MFLLSISLFLVIGSTAVIGRTVGRALFLSGLPPEYIPVRFLAVTVGVVLTSLLYARIAGRFRSHHLIQRTTLVMIAGLLAFRFLLDTRIATSLWLLGSFYVFLEIVMALNIVQFWTFASEIFNTRQAKRLFPIVTGVSNFGSMLAGASVTLLVPWLGTSNLLYVIAGMLAANILLVRSLGRRQQASYEQSGLPASVSTRASARSAGEQSKSRPQSAQNALGFLHSYPLLGTMAIVVVLTTLVVNVIDYQFDLTLKNSFASNPQGVSAFLGSFYFWTGIAGLVQQVFFTGPVLRRFGIVPALLIMPLGILAGSFAVLASGAALWAVTLARSPDTVFRYTVHDTSFNLLYVPIPHQLRSEARTVIDGIFKPFTIGLAGGLFFLVNRLAGISVLPWSYIAILVVALVMIASLRLRPLYVKTLQDSIRRRYFDPAGEPVDLSDRNTIAIIEDTLRQPDEAQILQALALADEISHVDWTLALLPLIEHESPLVRQQALRTLRSSVRHTRSPKHAALVQQRFADPDVNVQASAIFTYWALRGDEALQDMRPFMQHSEPKVQSAAVSGALRYGGEAARRIARPVFLSMVAHSQPAVRISAAYALGELPSGDGNDLLHLLLEDQDIQVRLQAIHSAGYLADLKHLPSLIAQLGDSIAGADVADALVRYGAPLIAYLGTYYTRSTPDLNVRRNIPGVVARIPDPQSAQFLLGSLDEPDDLARARVYLALGRLRREGVQLTETDLAALNQRFETETRLAYQWAVRASNPELESHSTLLEDAYSWRRRYALDRLLYLIAILYPRINISQVRANLFGDDLRRRANAIELLDTVLFRRHKELFLPLLESSAARMLEIADRVYHLKPPQLQSEFTLAVKGNDSWLAACTLFSLSRLWQAELSSLINQGLSSPNALVHETAELAARQQFEPEDPITLHGYIKPDHDPQLYKQTHHRLRSQAVNQEGDRVMPITTMERILLLRGVELFKEIPAHELELIARLCTVVHFPPGERFISQGDASDGLYILVAGEVEVSKNDLGVVNVSKAGDVVGEMGVLANRFRAANCTALVETTALHIDQTDLWDLLERSSLLSVSVIRVMLPKLLNYSNNSIRSKAGPAPAMP